MADWKDILSDKEEQLSEEELLKYLDEDLPEEEKYLIEEKINNSPFEAEALQGLLQFENKENLQKHVNQLNHKLKQLTGKRQRKEKTKVKVFEWIILAILLLLFVCVISYIVISLHHRSVHSQNLYIPVKGLLG
jgi:type II secretory pathway component PulL